MSASTNAQDATVPSTTACKITKNEITKMTLDSGCSRYQGPGGFSIPLVWLVKRMPKQFNNLETKLKLSQWEPTDDCDSDGAVRPEN